MKQYVCSICSYTYDEAKGIPEAGIAPGTKWEDLPEDWKCPLCGAGKSEFREKSEQAGADPSPTLEKPHAEQELSAMEMSIICSNLARGCEKQYLQQQAEDFKKLAEF
ncbi:MAG: rubredoxin, partial [Oscillospiraceae bacterium]